MLIKNLEVLLFISVSFLFISSVVGVIQQGVDDSCGGFRVEPKECPQGMFCNYTLDATCGFADAPGTCSVIPEGCTLEYKPVCGCDGQTYPNKCAAWSNSTSVISEDSCPGESQYEDDDDYNDEVDEDDEEKDNTCGGFRTEPKNCGPGKFCNYSTEAICGAADATGTCQTIPEVCTREYNPVCGCDGKTYSNKCEAWANSTSVSATGSCTDDNSSGQICGGFAGIQCSNVGEECFYPPENNCGRFDQTGVCETVPQICTMILDPVCGCDNKTYSNACVAKLNRVSIFSFGPCETPTVRTQVEGRSCRSKSDCSRFRFCRFADGSCGKDSSVGTCVYKRTKCNLKSKQNRQVCGCDGNTYASKCSANAAGVSVKKNGKC